MPNSVPNIVIHRLPFYLRALEMMAENGQVVTSSQELGDRLGISSAQIRKDLSHFGEFGKQGTGYEVDYLRQQLRRILKIEALWGIAIVGAGDLGHALVNYAGFRERNFLVETVFDMDPKKVGTPIGSLKVEDQSQMLQRLKELDIKIAIIAVPARNAQTVAELLIEGGVRAILNYAPITLNVPDEVCIEYIDPVIALQSMTYYLERESMEQKRAVSE
ncbi:MAG: redox-sensing transcriptional repressor Rex [Ardenticatenales bacterium]|nr:redox-sensing transcriptional repressor Rex [Ardenticatenales bacterium]